MNAPLQPCDILATTVPVACQRLGVGRTTIYELIKAGELRTLKIGSRTLIPDEDQRKLIERRLAEQTRQAA